MNARPYQQEAIKDMISLIESGCPSIMRQLITGGGKTWEASNVIRHFMIRGLRVWFVADRAELIDQAHEALKKVKIFSGIIKADRKVNENLACQVCSIQTIINRHNLTPPDLIIFDEAHGVQADNSYGTIIKRYPKAQIIGLTATPTRMSGRGFADIFDKLLLGPKFDEMIEKGYLSPLEYMVCSNPDLSHVQLNSMGEYEEEQLFEAMKVAPLVPSYLEHAADKSLMTFAINVKHSKLIESQYNEAGIEMVHVDGNTNKYDRDNVIKRFKSGKIKRICNVGLYTKGFDFPGLECIQLARSTKSLALYLQMIGRVTRKAEGKEFGIVLDNASCHAEGWLPWMDFDWNRHFVGYKKKRRTKIEDEIEMIEFEVEDNEGNRKRTTIPSETEGLKLVNIKTITKDKTYNILSLKEFDNTLSKFINIKHIKYPGYTATKNYIDFCRRKHFAIDEAAWDYIYNKLTIEPKDHIKQGEDYIFEVEGKRNDAKDKDTKDFYQAKIDDVKKRMKKVYRKDTRASMIDSLKKKYMEAESKMNFKQVDI